MCHITNIIMSLYLSGYNRSDQTIYPNITQFHRDHLKRRLVCIHSKTDLKTFLAIKEIEI